MILREILKKIRQIEIHANRIVRESAERGCPSRSAFAWARAFGSSRKRPSIEAATGETPALLSLTPGFSQAFAARKNFNPFNGFPLATKPLKRLEYFRCFDAGLKPGANETSSP